MQSMPNNLCFSTPILLNRWKEIENMTCDKAGVTGNPLSQETLDEKDVVFGYFFEISCGWTGKDYGDFSIEIYPNGKLIYKTYLFSRIEKSKTEYRVSANSVLAMKAVIKKHRADIDSFNNTLNNGTYDGSGDFFIFEGKELITWNISHTNELLIRIEEKRKKSDPYFSDDECLAARKQENKILFIFSEIVQILKKEGISLRLGEVKFDQCSQ